MTQKNFSKLATKLQNEIYQKMSVKKKIEIAGQFFLLGKKLSLSKPILEKLKK